jgi:1-deoxy-D-xylulose-5-phosphate synthase
LHLGLPDSFIEQGSREELLRECGLDTDGILASTRNFLASGA